LRDKVFASSIDFKNLVSQLWDKGVNRFCVELSQCVTMDSTFLGILAALGSRAIESEGTHVIELVNPNARILETLETLGISHLFKTFHSTEIHNTEFNPAEPAPQASRAEITRTSLEAHQTLMDINPANIPKFKDVAQFLAEDMKKRVKD